MFNITNLQRNANKSHNEIPSHTCQNGSHQYIKKQAQKIRTLVHRWWEFKLVQPLGKAVWRYLLKRKMDLPFDPVISHVGIYLKEPKTLIQKNISTPRFIATLFIITKIWKQPKCPSVNEWIKQLWDIYTMEYFLAIKRENFTPSTIWMDLENIMLSKISQSGKDKWHMISFLCGI